MSDQTLFQPVGSPAAERLQPPMPQRGFPGYISYPPAQPQLRIPAGGAFLAVAGMVLAIMALFAPFIDSNGTVTLEATSKPIDGSYMTSAIIGNRTMGYSLVAVLILAILAVMSVAVKKTVSRSLAMGISIAALIAGGFVTMFAAVYMLDPYLQDAYTYGASRGIGQWLILGAGAVTILGAITMVMGVRKNFAQIRPVQG